MLDMLQNNIDLRTYYKERLLPFIRYRKQQRVGFHRMKKPERRRKNLSMRFMPTAVVLK